MAVTFVFKLQLGARRGSYRILQLPAQSVPITTNIVSLNPAHGEVYSIQHYVINFVSGFLCILLISSANKDDRHNITELLLRVVLSTIPLTQIAIIYIITSSSCTKCM